MTAIGVDVAPDDGMRFTPFFVERVEKERITKMTEAQRKKAKKLLLNQGSAYEIAMEICIVVLTILWIGLLVIWKVIGDTQPDAKIGMFAILIFVLAEILLFIWLVSRHWKTKRQLKERYLKESPERKEELIKLAASFKKEQGLGIGTECICGYMAKVRTDNSKMKTILCFRYFYFEELVWAFRVNNEFATTSQYGGNPTIYKSNEMIRIYTSQGDIFDVPLKSSADATKLLEKLGESTDHCLLGYTKENMMKARGRLGR